MRKSPDSPDGARFLSQEMCHALITQVRSLGLGRVRIDLESWWRGDVRWARNRITTASDWRDNLINLDGGSVASNQLDTTSLRAAVRWAKSAQLFHPGSELLEPPDVVWPPVSQTYPKTKIWSDATYAQVPEARSEIATQLAASAEQAGMLSAGYLSVEAHGVSFATPNDLFLYAPQTVAQCSMTVRDPQGTGSGWAGASSYDWGRFDAKKLAEIALDKCLRSRNPVRIEPGRYTLIMEPQATFELIQQVLDDEYMRRMRNEDTTPPRSVLPFNEPGIAYQYQIGQFGREEKSGKTRVGQRVFDERLSIRSDPLDPDLGTLPFTYDGDPYVLVSWVDQGVLTTLAYDQTYALRALHTSQGKPWSGAFRVEGSGPPVSIEEMVATTKRGLLVTRFWGIRILDASSVLCTGVTRDGLWLIENGKISKPVKNLRFTESPMFAFNSVEQIGVPVPVFSPDHPAVVPPIKVRDFSFTSLVDAV